MPRAVARRQREAGADLRDPFLSPPQPVERLPLVAASRGRLPVEHVLEREVELLHRLLEPARARQELAEIVVRLGEVGLQLDRLAVVALRVRHLPVPELVDQGAAQVGLGEPVVALQRLVELAQRLLGPLPAQRLQTEVVVDLGAFPLLPRGGVRAGESQGEGGGEREVAHGQNEARRRASASLELGLPGSPRLDVGTRGFGRENMGTRRSVWSF